MTSTVYLCNRKRCENGNCIGKPGGYCAHTQEIEFARNKTGPWTFKNDGGHLVEVERKENAS